MRLQEKYKKEIAPEMIKKFGYKSPMAVPRLEKVVVNCGFGKEAVAKTGDERDKMVEQISQAITLICGQKPAPAKAKKSIAAFKLREGLVVGLKATLRGRRMYQFLEKLIFVALPRMRDFRGIPLKSVSENGDLTVGFRDCTLFPEIKIEKEKGIFGLEVVIANNAKTREEGIELLRLLGAPLQKNEEIGLKKQKI